MINDYKLEGGYKSRELVVYFINEFLMLYCISYYIITNTYDR